MGQIYKSTITIYSDKDWSNNSIADLAQDVNNGSICQIWKIDKLDEVELYQEEHAEEILMFFGILEKDFEAYKSAIFSDDEYEFYSD